MVAKMEEMSVKCICGSAHGELKRVWVGEKNKVRRDPCTRPPKPFSSRPRPSVQRVWLARILVVDDHGDTGNASNRQARPERPSSPDHPRTSLSPRLGV